MYARILLAVCCVLVLSGCATTNNTQDGEAQVKQYQNRITFLEAELQKKNGEISSMEASIEKAQGAASEKQQGQAAEEKDTAHLSSKQIQAALKSAGFYDGPVDGKVGSKTRKAIKNFQKANDLQADGIVGKTTSSKLSKYLNN